MGKIILFRDRTTQVVFRDQAQALRSFAEPQSLQLLQPHDPLDVLDAELSLFRENAADAAVVTRENTPRPFDRQDIFLGGHRHFSTRTPQSPSGVPPPAKQAAPNR